MINERIKRIRNINKLSQGAFSERIGVHRRSVQNYEQDASSLAINVAQKICQEFNIELMWLLTGQGDMNQNMSQSQNNPITENNHQLSVVYDHMEIVKGFKDHQKAKQINEKLIELEDLNPDLLDDIEDKINTMLSTARRMVEMLEKKTEQTGPIQHNRRVTDKAS